MATGFSSFVNCICKLLTCFLILHWFNLFQLFFLAVEPKYVFYISSLFHTEDNMILHFGVLFISGRKLSHSLFLTFYFALEYIWLINNVVIVSDEQWKNSTIRTHVSILPQISLLSRLPHSIEQSSMCQTVGSCWLLKYSSVYMSILNSLPVPSLHASTCRQS